MIATLIALTVCAADEKPKLVVMPISAQRIEASVVKVLDEMLLNEADRVGRFQIIGTSDLNAMLGLEKMKSAIGCDDVTCAAELGGALGAGLLLSVNAGILGDKLELSAKLIDTERASVVQRGSVSVSRDETAYADGLRELVAKIFAGTGAVAVSTDAEIPPEHATAVKSSGLAYADWLVLQQFATAGMGRPEYDQWRSSGFLYAQWAEHHNTASESWVLEILKWAATGATAFCFAIAVDVQSEPSNAWNQAGFLTLTAVAGVVAATTWGFDLAQIGNVPLALPPRSE